MIQKLKNAVNTHRALLLFDLMTYLRDAGIGMGLEAASDEVKIEVREELLKYHKKFKGLEAKCALAGGHVLVSLHASNTPEILCTHCGHRPDDPDGSYASRTYLEVAGERLIEVVDVGAGAEANAWPKPHQAETPQADAEDCPRRRRQHRQEQGKIQSSAAKRLVCAGE